MIKPPKLTLSGSSCTTADSETTLVLVTDEEVKSIYLKHNEIMSIYLSYNSYCD